MKILGVIPARAGSKGVPNKNIKILGNKPLIQFTAEAAQKCKYLDRVLLTTDSEEIARIGRGIGLYVPFLRPSDLAIDTAPTLPVIQHALQYLEKGGMVFDAVCLLQATSPFRPDGFIDAAIERFIEKDADSLISVLPVPHEYNPHWVFEEDTDGYLRIATGEKEIIKRRQELPNGYYRDGSIYITKTKVIMGQGSLYGQNIAHIVSDLRYKVNIDTMDDWYTAENKYKELYNQ